MSFDPAPVRQPYDGAKLFSDVWQKWLLRVGLALQALSNFKGDVTGSASSTVVATVGGSSAAAIHTAEQLANAATSAATPNTIVERDANGNFQGNAAGFTGNLAGDVSGPQSKTVLAQTGVQPGTYGDAAHVPQLAIDAKGRITGAAVTAVQTPTAAIAYASGALTLTNAFQDLPGTSLVLTPGRYLVHGVFDFTENGAGDVGVTFIGALVVNGVSQTAKALFVPTAASGRATVAQQWYVVVGGQWTVKLQAEKTGGTGTSVANITHSGISVIWLGP